MAKIIKKNNEDEKTIVAMIAQSRETELGTLEGRVRLGIGNCNRLIKSNPDIEAKILKWKKALLVIENEVHTEWQYTANQIK